jgi:hypothetical protein
MKRGYMHLALLGLETALREMADQSGLVLLSNRKIAVKLQVGQRQLNEMITELVEEGRVYKTRGLVKINGSVKDTNGSVKEPYGSVTDARHERVRDHENHENHEKHEKHEDHDLFKEKKHSHGHCIAKTKPNPEDDKGFEAFWTDYPKKVGKAAVVAWWSRTNPDDELLMLILEGLDKWREVWTTRGTELRWIPHPMTWLHQRRYEDDPS